MRSEWLSRLIYEGVYNDGDIIQIQLEQINKEGTIGIFTTKDGKNISINLSQWDELTPGKWYKATIIKNGKYVNAKYHEIPTPDDNQKSLSDLFEGDTSEIEAILNCERQSRDMCLNYLESKKKQLENEIKWIDDISYYLKEEY